MQYRLYEPGDFSQLYAIEEACFQPPLRFPRAYMRSLLLDHSAATWVAVAEEQLTAFAIVKWDHELAYIETLEVAAAFRKQGIGLELLQRMESSARSAGAKSIWLHVDTENSSAIRLYERSGYRLYGNEQKYYATSHDAFVYTKPL